MTTAILVVPNHHPLLITQTQSMEHNGLNFHNYSQRVLLPGDPKQQFYISQGGSIVIDELKDDDPRAVAEREQRKPIGENAPAPARAPYD